MKIPLEKIFEWLNVITPTHLSMTSREMIQALEVESLSDRNIDHLIEEVIDFSRNSTDPLEYAEVLAQVAVVRVSHGDLKNALDYLTTAAKLYEGNHYKYAVVLWMLAWVEWRLMENRKAYVHWTEARDLLQSVVNYLGRTHKTESFQQIPWFLERIGDMNQELARRPEEAYSWINLFEATHLDETALGFRKLLDQTLADNKTASTFKVMETMRELVSFAPDYLATPEGLVEVGLAAHQLGIGSESEIVLKKAVVLYKPESHHQASVLWMLGAVQLSVQEKTLEAIQNWERSLRIFENIPQRLKPRDRKAYKEWLQGMLPVLRNVLEAAVQEYA